MEKSLVGAVVRDRYEVVRLLGEGGMGAVYAVKDRQGGGERALKILGSGHGGLRVAQHRFKREFSTISRLRHPGIVGVFDFGDHEGVLYYVMELLTHQTLSDWLPRTADLPPRAAFFERLGRLADVVDALGYVHRHHLIHRDLKPSNLIFSRDGRLKLADFGLAKDFDNAITLTESGAILGTLSHMAPEQLQGRKLDHRADLYSLGVILYQLATGRLPFNESNPLALMRQQVTQTPIAPSRHNPDLPREFDDVALKLLSRDPVDRYPNAAAVASDLALLVRGETPSATRQAASSSDMRTVLQTAAGYVGRQEELGAMQKSVEQAGAGEGGVVVITGEAGAGKTRFVEEFCARALLYGVTMLKGRADRRAGVFYRPFIEMIEGYAARIGQYDSEVEAACFADVGRVLARIVPRLLERPSVAAQPEPPRLDAAESKLRLFDAVSRFLLRIAKTETLALFFDDFHQADELSLELFQYLGRNARTARLLLIAACRGEELAPRGGKSHPVEAALAMLRREGVRCESVLLKRLTAVETERMAEALAGGRKLSREFVARLYERTAGVPYFVEELMRWLRDRGALEKGAWPEEVPETIEAMLRERLEGIPEETLAVLRSAAVVGEEFEFETLLSASGDDEGKLLEAVDAGVRARVLKERPGERYAFVHPLLRMMLYAKMLPRRRRLLHAAVAKSLEERGGERTREAAEALAYHWNGAGEREKAAAWSLEAARKSFAVFANAAARQHAEAAIRVLEEKGDEAGAKKLYEAQDLLWEILMFGGSSAESKEAGERLLRTAERTGDPERRAQAKAKIAQSLQQGGDYEGSMALLREALAETQSKGLRAQSLGRLGFTLAEKLGRAKEGLEYAERAMKEAEGCDDAGARYQAMNAFGVAHLRAGHVQKAAEQMAKTVEYARSIGKRAAEANALNNLSVAYEAMGDLDRRVGILRQALDLSREIGYIGGECLYLVGLASNLVDRDSPDAEPTARQALELSRRAGFATSEQSALYILAYLAAKRADFEGCLRQIAEMRDLEAANVGALGEARTLEAEALACLGRNDDAAKVLETAAARIRPAAASSWGVKFAGDRADLLMQMGRFAESAAALEEAAPHVAASDHATEKARHETLAARLAALRGDAGAFDAMSRGKWEEWTGGTVAFARAKTRIKWADAMRRIGRTREARELWMKAEDDLLKAGLPEWWAHAQKRHPELAELAAQAKPEEARTEVRAAPPSEVAMEPPPFVGRDDEMAWLRARARDAQDKRSGGLVVVRGPTGIGKTRLLREFAGAAVSLGMRVFVGAGREDLRSTAHAPLLPAVLKALESLPRERVAPDVAAAIRQGVPELAEHPGLSHGAAATTTIELSPEQQRVRVHDGMTRLFEAAASLGSAGGGGGLTLLLDDLAAADEATLDFAAYLARDARRHAILVVAAVNSEELNQNHPLVPRLALLQRDRDVVLRDLEPLRPADIALIVEALLGRRKDCGELAAVVAEKAAGNPLFARELLLAMFRGNHVDESDGAWRLKTRSVRLPDTIAGLLRHQLKSLSAEDQRVLEAAAVLGREFEFDTLMTVAGLPEPRLLDRLEALSRTSALEPVPGDPLGRDLYRFHAPQMREVVYAGIDRKTRAALHLRAAEALEKASLSKKGVSAGELAHHYVLGGGGKKARDWSLEAGRKAARVCANSQAILHLENVVRVMSGNPDLRDDAKLFDALSELAVVRLRAGDNAVARRLCDDAVRVASTPMQRLRVSRGMVHALHRAGDLREATLVGENALLLWAREAHGAPPEAKLPAALPAPKAVSPEEADEVASLLTLLAFEHMTLGRGAEAAACSAAARPFAERSQKPEALAGVLRNEAYFLADAGKSEEAFAALDRALRLARDSGNRWTEAALLNNLAGFEAGRGRLKAGLDRYVESARAFAEVGDLVEHGRQLASIGHAQFGLGLWTDAEVTLTQALDLNRRLREKRSHAFCLASLARLDMEREERDKARTEAQEALKLAQEVGVASLAVEQMGLLATLCRREGNVAGARQHHRRALEEARRSGQRPTVFRAALEALETELAAGDLGEARMLLDEARGAAGESSPAFARAAALLEEARGRFDAAADAHRRSLQVLEVSENPLESATARLDLGRALAARERREGGPGEAAIHLASARDALGRLGARWYLGQARAVLESLGRA